MVKDICPGSTSGIPRSLSEIGSTGSFVFSADDGFHGSELWIKEGPNDLVRQLKDINTRKKNSPPKDLTILNDKLFFTVDHLNEGIKLWESDFTRKGTQKVEDFKTQQCNDPSELTILHNSLYFFAYDGRGDQGLWKKNDKEEHHTLIKAFETPNIGPPPAKNLIATNNRLFFVVSEVNHGTELWVIDGTIIEPTPLTLRHWMPAVFRTLSPS